MIFRAIVGMVLGGALAVGALYGADRYLGLEGGARVTEPALSEPEVPQDLEQEPVPDGTSSQTSTEGGDEEPGDDRLTLPYVEGEEAAWLAEVLDGQGPFAYRGAVGESVDLAALARAAAETPSLIDGEIMDEYSASCDASHVVFSCTLAVLTVDSSGGMMTEHYEAYTFILENIEGQWRVADDSVRGVFAG